MSPITLPFPMIESPPVVEADISRYNAMILPDGTVKSHFDFDKYKKKSRIISLRGGVAADGLDFEFAYNLQKCEEKGIYISKIYHYTKLWKNLDSQADIILEMYNMAKSLAPNYYLNRIVLDIEANDGLPKTTFTGNAEKLVNKVYSKTGVIPTIYTRAYFWNQNTYIADWMKNCPLWVAHYFHALNPYSIPAVRPYIPDAWGAIHNPIVPIEWQFDTHDNGIEWGSTGDNEIDLNFFTFNSGTKNSWEQFYGKPYLEPIESPPPQGEDLRIMTIDKMSIRREPVYKDSNLFGKGIVNKIVKVIGEPINGYVPIEAWVLEKSLKKK